MRSQNCTHRRRKREPFCRGGRLCPPDGHDRFAATYRKNGCASCGSMWASTPTNIVCVRIGAFDFAGAYRRADRVVRPYGCVPFRIGAPVSATLYRAGGVEPLPYGNWDRLYGFALVHSNLPVRTAQSYRHGFAVPPPFTQGRLGAVQTRRRSRNLQKAGRASPAPTLRQILYFFLTG